MATVQVSGYPPRDDDDLIIRSLRNPLIVYLLGLGATPDEVDDLAQDVLIAVWPRIGGIAPEALYSYAETAARNALIKHRALSRNRFEVTESQIDACTDDLASDPLALEAFETIYRDDELRQWSSALLLALGSLCESQREALIHRYVLGRSISVTADITGASIQTVKRRTHHGITHLRKTHPTLADLLDGRDTDITHQAP